jgi:hypothetical protein
VGASKRNGKRGVADEGPALDGTNYRTAPAEDGRRRRPPAGRAFDLYAQVVTERQQAAADAMAARFLEPTPRDIRGMGSATDG